VPTDLSEVDLSQFPSRLVEDRLLCRVAYSVEVKMAAKEGVLCFKVVCEGETVGNVEMEYANE
jgi:hypothetical protein